MKKLVLIFFAIGMVFMSTTSMAAMSSKTVRNQTRFLTDKMAYELNLSPEQYNDVYEINYDFIYNVRPQMNGVINGNNRAMNNYYSYLDTRNDDLRWVLTDFQYRKFLNIDYFYRPVYASGGSWNLRVYISYPNPLQFFLGIPRHYNTYSGGHYRTHNNNVSFYRNRYHQDTYRGSFSVKSNKVYSNNRRADFGNAKSNRGNVRDKFSEPKRDNRSMNQHSVKNNDMYRTDKSNNERKVINNNSNHSSKSDYSGRKENSVSPSNRFDNSDRGSSSRVFRDNSSKGSDRSSKVSTERKRNDNVSSKSRRPTESSSNHDKKGSSDNEKQDSRSRR